MRMIDADALLTEIQKKEAEPSYQHTGEDWCVGLIIAEGLVDEQPTIEPQKWVSCSERLPSDHERYLLTEEVHYTTGRIIRRVLMAFYDDENDEWYEEQGEDVEVVSYPLAWMPLPECYEGD